MAVGADRSALSPCVPSAGLVRREIQPDQRHALSSDMSPMSRRSGTGSRLISVGGDDLIAARQRQVLVDVDDLELVETWRCSSQIRRTFWIARTDRPVVPVTYRRSTYLPGRSAASVCFGPGRRRGSRAGRSARRPQVEPDQHALLVRQVADDLLHGRRQPADERGQGHDLVAARELRLLQQVDHLDAVAAGQMVARRWSSRFRSAAAERALWPASRAAESIRRAERGRFGVS